ncbi:YdaE family protein [Citrobacter braakii]|uniref:YdaE family protein n=1 Tax=Citrobacter braakii TaxID=57706 RepID=UPI004039EEC5
MNPMVDFCFCPARQQAVMLPLLASLARSVCYTLAQKGDPTIETVKCAYHLCNNEVKKEWAVKSTVRYLQGNIFREEKREYCSQHCAECDRMANEP